MSETKTPRMAWYVVHTYSGYENKVKANLEKTIENRNLQEMIREVLIPTEEVYEIKNNQRRIKSQKLFPGYVLVQMVMTDETWYIVRNTRGVTGFVGPGSRPVPLTEEEMEYMTRERKPVLVEFAVGQHVKVLTGPLEAFEGVVEEVMKEDRKLRVVVSMFGRDTPVEMDFDQVEPLS